MSRILVVDDEPSCRAALARLLEIEGYETATACDGLEAMDQLKRQAPDLVLLDMFMPKMDGVGFLEAIRHDHRWDSLPVLLVTGEHDSRRMKQAISLGAREYLFKSDIPFNRLLGIVRKHLGERVVAREKIPSKARGD